MSKSYCATVIFPQHSTLLQGIRWGDYTEYAKGHEDVANWETMKARIPTCIKPCGCLLGAEPASAALSQLRAIYVDILSLFYSFTFERALLLHFALSVSQYFLTFTNT